MHEHLVNVVPRLPQTVHHRGVTAVLDDVEFAFQPLFNLCTGGVIAVEALARPSHGPVRDLLRAAADTGQLTPTDFGLVAEAIRSSAACGARVPLHVNLLAVSVTRAHRALGPVLDALRETNRQPADVIIELNPPFSGVPRHALLRGLEVLSRAGFRLTVDCVGEGDQPLTLFTLASVEALKLDPAVVAGLPDESWAKTTIEAMVYLCDRNGKQLIAEGVETEEQLTALRELGVRIAQGDLLHPPSAQPSMHATIGATLDDSPKTEPLPLSVRRAGPRVTDLMHPATTLPAAATSEEVRTVLAAQQTVNSVVLLDEAGRPAHTIDRNRFLLAVTGPYGHALHAKRGAARLGDKPHVVPVGASVFDVFDMLATTDRRRTNDDIIVIDAAHRCLGVVRVTDLIRAIADSKVEQAVALNPLTRLPGTDMVAAEIAQRIASNQVFAVGWLDIDRFKSINDEHGFAAGDEVIRRIGAGLSEAAAAMPSVRVSHVGGDDFVFVAGLDDVMPLGSRLIDAKWQIEGESVTVSLATLVCMAGSVRGYPDVSRLLAPLKRHAKSIEGPSWVVGRPGTDRIDVLRDGRRDGRAVRAVDQRVAS